MDQKGNTHATDHPQFAYTVPCYKSPAYIKASIKEQDTATATQTAARS
jgi:hypothetical protein